LADERSLREAAEAKVKMLKKALREKETLKNSMVTVQHSQPKTEDSPQQTKPQRDIPLSRASSTDSLEVRAPTQSEEVSRLTDEPAKAMATSRPEDKPAQVDRSRTPPRPSGSVLSNGGSVQTTPKQSGSSVESQAKEGATAVPSGGSQLQSQQLQQTHLQNQPLQNTQAPSDGTSGTKLSTQRGMAPLETSFDTSHAAQAQAQPTTPVKGSSPSKAQISPQGPQKQIIADGILLSAPPGQTQSQIKTDNAPQQPHKGANMPGVPFNAPQNTGFDHNFQAQHQRSQSFGSTKSASSDFDPLKPRASTSQPDAPISQEQRPVQQVLMMEQQAMTFPIVGVATAGVNNFATDRQQSYPQSAYQDVQQMFFVPQDQFTGVDLSQSHMMAIQQPFLQWQTSSFNGQTNAGWNNGAQQLQFQQQIPYYAQLQPQTYMMNPPPQQQAQLSNRQGTGFDPLQPQQSSEAQQQPKPPGQNAASFDPLHPQSTEHTAPSQGESAFGVPPVNSQQVSRQQSTGGYTGGLSPQQPKHKQAQNPQHFTGQMG
jgi:hypothetical protein